jgi:hypothetical protein
MADVSIPNLTVSYIQTSLDYDEETGLLYWKERPRHHFKRKLEFNRFNNKFAGLCAGCVKPNGYVHLTINHCTYSAHRICWALYYGCHPTEIIDHIDGNKANNRIANLRLVSHEENAKNRPLSSRNKSGVSGVGFYEGRWQVTIGVDRTVKYLGVFRDKDEAIAARMQAEREYGYHPNHGRPM